MYYVPPPNLAAAFHEVNVSCGATKDTLRLLTKETAVEVRVFTDHALTEAYFQQGRVAMTVPFHVPFDHATVALEATAATTAAAEVYPVRDIWTTVPTWRAFSIRSWEGAGRPMPMAGGAIPACSLSNLPREASRVPLQSPTVCGCSEKL